MRPHPSSVFFPILRLIERWSGPFIRAMLDHLPPSQDGLDSTGTPEQDLEEFPMRIADRISRLGTETAFAVSMEEFSTFGAGQITDSLDVVEQLFER